MRGRGILAHMSLAALWIVLAQLDPARPTLLFAAAAVLMVAAVVVAMRRPHAVAPAGTGPGGVLAWQRALGVPRYVDPDAPGRARPRAPTALR